MHPIIIIIALIAGSALLGVVGTLLAVPFALIVSAFVGHYRGDAINGGEY